MRRFASLGLNKVYLPFRVPPEDLRAVYRRGRRRWASAA